MPKFKVGDKVVVLPRKDGQRFQEPYYLDIMMRHVGRPATVEHEDSAGHYTLRGIPLFWHSDWLEPLVDKPIESAADMEALYG